MKNIYSLLLLFVMFIAIESSKAQTYRYSKSIFPSATKTADVVYGNAPFLNSLYNDESATTAGDLVMDIYEPTGDTRTDRPAIIFAHGGGFATGNRNVDDMEAFCDSFARKGYVTVTIDYRQGVEVTDNGNLHYTRAAYRGLQDGRAAVRFLRTNAATYGIDPTKIYWGGNSAGSFIGLNAIYMDSDEKPTDAGAVSYTINVGGYPVNYSGPDLGSLDIGDNLSENGEPDAVMACWGGVGDTLPQIDAVNNQNVFLVHGTADGIVPFNSGAPFGLSGINPVYGSNAINTRLTNLGIPAQMTYFVTGEDHEFYGVDNGDWENGTNGNEYWDTVVVKATKFYHEQFKPTADFSSSVTGLDVDFTDLSIDAISRLWDFGDNQTSTDVNTSHTYSSIGIYNVKLYIENSQANWDTIVKEVKAGAIPMHGVYTIGAGEDFANLSDAANSLYFNGLDATVTFELTANYDDASENFPIVINKFDGASSTNSLTIKPASGVDVEIIGSSGGEETALIIISSASHITIDGLSQNLIVANTTTSENTGVIAAFSESGEPSSDITIKNCIIKSGINTVDNLCIYLGENYSNVTIENNDISKALTGIICESNNVSIINNILGSNIESDYLQSGIYCDNCDNLTIQNNTIKNLVGGNPDGSSGVSIFNCTGNIIIEKNIIDKVINTGISNAFGLAIAGCNASKIDIINNQISKVASNCYTDNNPGGVYIGCPDMTSGINILYNSIDLSENFEYAPGTGDPDGFVFGIGFGGGSGIILKNNIIKNTLGRRNGATQEVTGSAIYCAGNTSPFAEISNNVYYAAGTFNTSFMSVFNSNVGDFVQWQTWTGETNSFFEDPLYTSIDDLNLQACSPAVAHAIDIPAITTDIEGNTRDTQYPTMGAYGYDKVQASNLYIDLPVKGMGYLSWTQGNGCNAVVFMKQGHVLPEIPAPVNGITYSPNVGFGDGDQIGTTGWYCVFNGFGSGDFWVYGADGEYTAMVCEYFGNAGNEIYLTKTTYNNPFEGMFSGSVNKLNSQSIKINPNPSTGRILIDFSKVSNLGKVSDIKISNISGKVIYENKFLISNNQLNIDLSDYSKGLYFIKIENSEGVITKKLILE